MASRLVMKFGGTSVADLERIRRVARLVAAEVAAGHKVAVVVSAMSGKTNELVAWTDEAGLLAIALRKIGVDARSWLGWQIPIISDEAHGRARIDDIPGEQLAASVDG